MAANEKPLELETPPVSGGQRLAGTEVQVRGPCVSVKANWWCSNWTGTLVAVPAVPPELRLVTVTGCVQEPVPPPLRLKLGGVPPVRNWTSATLQTPGTWVVTIAVLSTGVAPSLVSGRPLTLKVKTRSRLPLSGAPTQTGSPTRTWARNRITPPIGGASSNPGRLSRRSPPGKPVTGE